MFRQKIKLPSPRSQDTVTQVVKFVITADDKLTTGGSHVPAHEETVQSGFPESTVIRGSVSSDSIPSNEGRFYVGYNSQLICVSISAFTRVQICCTAF